MFVSGSQTLYGRYLAVNRQRINGVFTMNLLLALGLSLLIALALAMGVLTNATRFLVSRQPDLQMLNRYILGSAIGIPALMLGQQLFSFLSLENQTRRTMIASIACFAVNIVLNHLFIVILSMGIFGLGLSSSIASWVFLAVQAHFYWAGKSEWKFSLRSCRRQDALHILSLGYPGALCRFVETFRCVIVNFLLLTFVGSVGLSAFAAANSLLAVIWSVPFGMMAVSRMLFNISIGEKDRQSLVNIMHIALTRGMLVLCGIVALLVLFAEPLTRLFYRDPADSVYYMTVMGFYLKPLCMPLALVSLHFACYAQAAEKRILAILIPLIDGAVGVMLFSFLLIPSLKLNGLYIAHILNGFLCAAVIVVNARIELKRAPRSLEDLMAIPADFSVGPDERIDISVRSMDDVVEVSRKVIDFCESRGIDRRRAYYAGLCLEEMAGNVVVHGFSKDKRRHSVDIRVVHSDEDIILRIRDDCVAFNPSEMARVMETTDRIKNVGIVLVYSIASKVAYQPLLGMNELEIQL